jgi:hypothetical protein
LQRMLDVSVSHASVWHKHMCRDNMRFVRVSWIFKIVIDLQVDYD